MPSPMLLITHGTKAVDPVCEVTIVLFSVTKCTGGLSNGGNEAPSSFKSSPMPSSASDSGKSITLLAFLIKLNHRFLDMQMEITQNLRILCMETVSAAIKLGGGNHSVC